MPSCVVKSCKNHSGTVKKCQGITFHRFPSANEPWKEDWVQIIRECRNDNAWNPSKYSAICSIHFETSDLYTTKGGYLRVVTYGVPKKYLLWSPSIQEHITKITNEHNAETSSVTYEVPIEPLNIKKEPDTEADISNEFLPELLKIKKEETSEDDIPSSSHRVSPETALPLPGNYKEKSLYTPRERHLKGMLKKMQTLLKMKNDKIKILNQKVRRLQNRNESLKSMLEKLQKVD